jgi:hypothetical protein
MSLPGAGVGGTVRMDIPERYRMLPELINFARPVNQNVIVTGAAVIHSSFTRRWALDTVTLAQIGSCEG